jgi:uncharacterized phage protein (TIGR01671 family)
MCLYNYGTWFYGLLANPKVDLNHVKAGWYISNSVGMPFAYGVRPETIGEYIGLNDKNNKEIYKGDLIKFTLPEWTVGSGYRDFEGDEVDETVDERTIICEVQIRPTRGVGMVYRKDLSDEITDINLKYHWFKIHTKTDEIIGNIYENPELLKESKTIKEKE